MGIVKSIKEVTLDDCGQSIEPSLDKIHEQTRRHSVTKPTNPQNEAPPFRSPSISSSNSLPKGILKPHVAATAQNAISKFFGRHRLNLGRKNSLPGDSSFHSNSSTDELAYSALKRVRFSLSNYRINCPEDNARRRRDSKLSSSRATVEKSESSPEEILHFYMVACKAREEKPIPYIIRLFQNAINAKYGQSSLSGEISLSNHAIQLRAMDPLADVISLYTKLTTLSLENCFLTNESLKILLHCLLVLDSVHTLSLARNLQITGSLGLKYIAVYVNESRTLRNLDLSATACLNERKMIHLLAQALSEGPDSQGAKLETLKLNGCLMKASVLEVLAPALKRSNVRNLYLRHNKITSHGAISLGVLLHNYDDHETQHNPNHASSTQGDRKGIEVLDVSGNEIKGGIQYIAQALRRNKSLKQISLAENHLDSKDVKVFADLLKYNRMLKCLDLSRNHICTPSIDGLHALKAALAATSLSSLTLAETGLGTQAAVVIADALLETVCLRRLDLSGNRNITVPGVMALAAAMKINTSMTFLDINIPQDDPEMSRLSNDILLACTRNIREHPCISPSPRPLLDEANPVLDEADVGNGGEASSPHEEAEYQCQTNELRILHPLDLM